MRKEPGQQCLQIFADEIGRHPAAIPESSARVRFNLRSPCFNSGRTVDIHEIRRRNLRSLVEEHANGNLSQFVEVSLRGATSYKGLQQVTGPRAARNLGSLLARKIEAQLRLERGWMDLDHSGTAHTVTIPGGRSERVARLTASIESLPPSTRALVEKLVKALAGRSSKPRRKKKSAADSPGHHPDETSQRRSAQTESLACTLRPPHWFG